MSCILILGSGPNVTECRDWVRDPFDQILAINNAWRVRPDWNSVIYPEDFPKDRYPDKLNPNQTVVKADDYVPAQNRYGGFVYAGGTMAFTAGYWALDHYRPKTIAFFGCDMVYEDDAKTHFYGNGSADPLRDDVTLQSLEAKSIRFAYFAAKQNCAVVNLSNQRSRLTFPRATPDAPLAEIEIFDQTAVAQALEREDELGYMIPSGRYWQHLDQIDAKKLRDLDDLWMRIGKTRNINAA